MVKDAPLALRPPVHKIGKCLPALNFEEQVREQVASLSGPGKTGFVSRRQN